MYTYNAKVVRVVDGDTIDVIVDLGFRIQQEMRLRFVDIDAYELRTEIGKKAKAFVEQILTPGREIRVTTQKDKQEKYGRYLAAIDTLDGTDINQLLITNGFAIRKEWK